ncbi:MAG: RidA family protein [Melioribacteraceae bacterium]
MENRINISSGTPWEDKVGYSRVVKVGNHIFVTGTVAINDDGNIVGKTAFEQADFIISKIEQYLHKVNTTLKDVVRTRIFVTNIKDWEQIGKAHHKYFKNIKPATTMVEVSKLIDSNLLIEIEADAIQS